MKPTRICPNSYFSFKELLEFSDLLFILTIRDIKLRYKQTALGVVWVVLQPLLTSIIFAVFFGRFANLPSEGVPYIIFSFSGLISWNFFSQAIQKASNSVVHESRLISKVYFPRIFLPTSCCLAPMVDFLVNMVVMFILLILYQVPFTANLILLPFFIFFLLFFSIGISLVFSSIYVHLRDIQLIIPFMLQVWMFTSPLAYSLDIIPQELSFFYSLNPLVGIISAFRWCFLGELNFPFLSFSISLAFSLIAFLGGLLMFRRMERNFVDVI